MQQEYLNELVVLDDGQLLITKQAKRRKKQVFLVEIEKEINEGFCFKCGKELTKYHKCYEER
jgi:hypothetical protein